ncbi:formyltetrahydrofolate deformylase [Rhodomicrobium vannielii ATCC 17100]|jgi:formyltetrahydrofolate deformylase|uniref:Formyltetrahydrofolate deformylase n=2 Tax=Rhodomicrobium TaxID=1068 RepID=E3I585_RHOVT|nr:MULTISPECIES: formyltetrahydrofolate deformylase [Rhodomicrobium]ADP70535.1 formyltetrahydrofolate deformylase [Rhodomicrobium vannielii ATCC 17100]KAI93474.1 formyltetrahydrofolate deformylase [Rhodomicrobium udaipurense JA643]MBJ7533985.1 formyltetrahydrofolate deformylase [Rhodomicrobium vannielii ATCC 17100]MBJ7543825.1 formyltetrahydrofolate deformylase [Rhodomicrobium udaipurense]
MSFQKPAFVLTLSCADQSGIVASIAGILAEHGCNITDSAQFGDVKSNRFFMRVSFSAPDTMDEAGAERMLKPVVDRFKMTTRLHPVAERMRVLILVSKFGHCLNDLLYRHRVGALPVEIPAIVSNHRDFYRLAASHDIPFHHLPMAADTKEKQEHKLAEIIEDEKIDLVVLARYMQVLSEDLCRTLEGRAINIHHSFLPSFKGAKPYHQAHMRGVKLIGATAHYVTPALDEGPIIEQEVARVDHSMSIEDLVNMGRDVESLVLSRAVKWHVEHRILVNGNRTVVFR